MSRYSGAQKAQQARETLSKALKSLQEEKDVPQDVMQVTEHIAQSVGALFEAERASTERDGRSCVKSSIGYLSQTLALLQDARDKHKGIGRGGGRDRAVHEFAVPAYRFLIRGTVRRWSKAPERSEGGCGTEASGWRARP